MSFFRVFFARLRNFFSSRSPLFRIASLLVAGMFLFFAASLLSSTIRGGYGVVFDARVVKPFSSFAKSFASKKKDVNVISEEQQALREEGSLSSPYVEVGLDSRFPLLVRVWINADSSHVARVRNNDSSFPLSYERAVSEEGFVPIVGLSFGDNSFDLEILDSNSKRVAKHTLTANIEDLKDIQGWISVDKQATKNDFLSVSVYAGSPWGDASPTSKHRIVLDDFGKIRWVYSWLGEANRGRGGYAMLGSSVGDRMLIADDEGMKIVSVDVFGNREIIFDGENHSKEHDYKVHHDFVVTDKGTLLVLADPIDKKVATPPANPKIFSEEDYIIEIDLENGSLLREIDLKEIFPADWRAGPRIEDQSVIPPKKFDWMHLNSIDYNSEKSVIVLSGRNQSAVFALDYASGELAWLFSDPEGLGSEDAQVSSRRLSAPQGYRYHKAQHDAWLDGDRLLFFDNATLIKDNDGAYIPPSDVSSRIVEARLDLPNKRVVSVKTYEPKVIFSKITGGYDFRDDNYLICYCGTMKDVFGNYITDFRNSNGGVAEGQVFEIDKDSGQELLHFRIKGVSYRARYFDWQAMVK